jgi:lysyl-tRNA synthetase class I
MQPLHAFAHSFRMLRRKFGVGMTFQPANAYMAPMARTPTSAKPKVTFDIDEEETLDVDERIRRAEAERWAAAYPPETANEEQATEEQAVAELLVATDQALEASARHSDRIDTLLKQIRVVRTETRV